MQKKRVARLGEDLSVLGFGSWGISGAFGSGVESQYIRTIHAALDQGVNFFDTAPVYGLGESEKVLSKALRDRRSRVFLASKCGLVWDDQGRVRNDLSENSLIQEVPQILKRLGTDRLDLLQVHWPSPEFSLEATFTALAKIKEKGWALHLGVCNFSLSDFQKAQNYTPLDSYQGLYNMLEHNPGSYHGIDLSYKVREEILPETTTRGQGFFPYSPLMQGLLGGNIGPEKVFEKNDVRSANPKLTPPLRNRYLKLAQGAVYFMGGRFSLRELALLWLVHQEGVSSIIAGARTEKQITANARLMERSLSESEWQSLDEYLKQQPLIKER